MTKNLKNHILTYYLEYICFLAFILLTTVVSLSHELWYDELNAWNISKFASYHDMFFVLPSYEGHSPLWWLILSVFSKTGCDIAISLKVISITVSSIAILLLLFKSPFPKIIKLILPFTFWIFYQYTVISRPYCLTFLAFVLISMFWQEKDKKPLRLLLSLLLLSQTSAYGIVFAFVITLFWCIELDSFKNIFAFKTTRFWGMFALAGIVFLTVVLMKSVENELSIKSLENIFYDSIYCYFVMPIDSVFTTYLIQNRGGFRPEMILHDAYALTMTAILGIFLQIVMGFYFYKKRKLTLFILGNLGISTFCAFIYGSTHHIGLFFLFYLFLFWISISEKNTRNVKINLSLSKGLRNLSIVFIVLIQLWWTTSSSLYDIGGRYSCEKIMADFIKTNNLTNYRIWSDWLETEDEKTHEKTLYFDSPFVYQNRLLTYFDENIFENYFINSPTQRYRLGLRNFYSEEESNADKAKLREMGPPDIFINYDNIFILEDIFGEGADLPEYVCIEYYTSQHYFKNVDLFGDYIYTEGLIFMRADLAAELGFEEINPADYGLKREEITPILTQAEYKEAYPSALYELIKEKILSSDATE